MTPITDPFSLKSEDGYFWLKGNLHTHTTCSDGKVDPQARVDGYAGQGYDFLSITDHHKITPIEALSCPESLTLIPGVELHPDNPFGGQRHHFLALNVQSDIEADRMPPQHVIDAVKGQGGSIWLAHPYWSSINVIRDVLPLKDLDGIEVFNSTCRCVARGESGVHWDDWMQLTGRLLPALSNDDAHRDVADAQPDVYQGWTMVRVRERSREAIAAALVSGASYCSSGPEIHDLRVEHTAGGADEPPLTRVTLRCSPALRIHAICDFFGMEYWQGGSLFEEATFELRRKHRPKHVRFEIHGPDGRKAWTNPYALTALE